MVRGGQVRNFQVTSEVEAVSRRSSTGRPFQRIAVTAYDTMLIRMPSGILHCMNVMD